MNLRPLTWTDVKCEISLCYAGLGKPKRPVQMRDGRTKVFASLVGYSPVNTTLWIKDPDLNKPEFQAVVMLKLQPCLKRHLQRIQRYVV